MVTFDRQYNRSDLAARPYRRFEAVNGYAIVDEVKDVVSPKTWIGLNFMQRMKSRIGDEQMTPGMIGCYLSHYAIFEEIVAEGLPWAVIFEDDAKIHPRIYTKAISHIVEQDGTYPADVDIVLLGHHCIGGCYPGGPGYKRPKHFWGTHGYVISQAGAQKMLKLREPEITMQIDFFMSHLYRNKQINIIALHPQYAGINDFGSDIQMMIRPIKSQV